MPSPADPAVRDFLRRSLVAQVATRSPSGRAFMTPLWFVVDGGALYVATAAETWTAKNVAQHPEVALLFRDEASERFDRVLRLRGTATCHRGFPSWRVLLRVAAKYYAPPRALGVELRNARKWRLRTLYYAHAKGGPAHLRIVPSEATFLAPP